MNVRRWRAILVLALELAPTPTHARNRNVLVLDTGVPGRPLAAAMIGAFRDTLLGTAQDSLGLAGMKERLRLVDGELCVDSSALGGTVIAASVPARAMAVAAHGAKGEGGDDTATSPAR